MKLIDIIEVFIAGDWGEETYSKETPCAVTCVRGADIIPISEYDFSAIPVRYINQQAYAKKCLQVGDIIIEKSGGSPTQSTGRVSLVSQELLDHAGAVICSNFCTAFRVKKGWIPLYEYTQKLNHFRTDNDNRIALGNYNHRGFRRHVFPGHPTYRVDVL